VVDDGSRDETSSLVRRLADELSDIRLIRLAANHGKGYAVRSGVAILSAGWSSSPTRRRYTFPEIARLEAALDGGPISPSLARRPVAGCQGQAKLVPHLIGRFSIGWSSR